MNHISMNDEMLSRGLLSIGNSFRLKQLLGKLRSGREVRYGAIGGSITEGASASSTEKRYVERFAAQLRSDFNADIKVFNAGIGASNSLFGAFRIQKDLLQHQPDLITIEYAVNDTTNPDTPASYEAMIRKCLSLAPDTAIILIFTMNQQGVNLQHQHIPVGTYYQLPMLSYRDAVYPEIEKNRFTWRDISPDSVHPNDIGHGMIADMLSAFMRKADACESSDSSLALPGYLNPGAVKYEHTSIIDATMMEVVSNSGWTKGPHKAGYTGWQTELPGASLELSFTGSYLAIGTQQYCGDFGRLAVSVDGGPEQIIEGYFTKAPNTVWAGGHTVISIIGENLSPGRHSLKLTLLSERHPDSNGHSFDIGYLLTAGK